MDLFKIIEGKKRHNQRLSAQSAQWVFNFYLFFERIHKWHADDTDLVNFHGYISLYFQFIQLCKCICPENQCQLLA